MKLIDLLVQELPKRGGWPEGVNRIHQDHDGEVYAWQGSSCKLLFRLGIIADNCRAYGLEESIENMVTSKQYESALAASQKPAWSGEGLPPVGCECEWNDTNVGWLPVTIKYISEQVVVMASLTNLCGVHELTEIAKDIICDKPQFRPLRAEADKKRDAFINAVLDDMRTIPCDLSLRDEVAVIYDAIAAGKIPGVKLDD